MTLCGLPSLLLSQRNLSAFFYAIAVTAVLWLTLTSLMPVSSSPALPPSPSGSIPGPGEPGHLVQCVALDPEPGQGFFTCVSLRPSQGAHCGQMPSETQRSHLMEASACSQRPRTWKTTCRGSRCSHMCTTAL